MKKGDKRCKVCRRRAVGVLLWHFNGKLWYDAERRRLMGGSYGCQEHLEEASKRASSYKLSVGELIVAIARRG